jgi:hypothetical protein
VPEGIRPAIVPVEAATIGSYPQVSSFILDQCSDFVVTEAVGALRIVSVHLETVPIIAIQALLRAEPHEPQAVLKNAMDRTLGQPMLDRDLHKVQPPVQRGKTST